MRPKEIQLLISHKEGQLVPQKVCSVDLVLWDSPLGKTVMGSHPDIFEEATMRAYLSKTHFARSIRTAAFQYDELTFKESVTQKTLIPPTTQSNTVSCLPLSAETS